MPSEVNNHMNTLGVFSQPSFLSIGDEYVKKSNIADRHKGKQFTTRPNKKGKGNDAYFAKFRPLYEGEGFVDPGTHDRAYNKKQKKKMVGTGIFRPSSPPKKSTGLGNYHGCIGPKYDHLNEYSVLKKGELPPKKEAQMKNILTTPSKRGTYGTPGTLLQTKEYNHMTDPYNAAQIKEIEERKVSLEKRIDKIPFKSMSHSLDFFDTQNNVSASKIYTNDKPLPVIKQEIKKAEVPKTETPFKPSSPGKNGFNSTFKPFPKYIGDPYDDKEKLEREERKKNKASVVWRSVSYPKSVPTRSIVFSKK